MSNPSFESEFCTYAATRLRDNLQTIEKCLTLLAADQVWARPNDVSNSIGNLVLHLRGNVQQWIVASIGGQQFARNRPAEFAQRDQLPINQILPPLRSTIETAAQVIEALTSSELLSRVSIQGYDVTILSAVFHVVEHFSLHTGQIVYQTKNLTALDLSAYDPQGRRIDGRQAGVP
jgi:uncharacterized damage-inducible protein DinB